MKGGSIKLLLISAVAVGSVMVNIILWNSSDTNAEKIPVGEDSEKQSFKNKIDRPFQYSIKPTATVFSETSGAGKCGNTNDGLSSKLAKFVNEKDYRGLSNALINSGIPDSMVKTLVYSYLNFQESSSQNTENSVYWRKPGVKPSDSAAQMLEANARKRDELLKIFGDSAKDDPEFYTLFRPFQNKLNFLSSDKQVELQELQLTAITSSEFQSPAQIEQEIKGLLGPEDYAEYQLRESPTAKTLQQELAAFDYSEQDYRELYRIKKESASGLYDSNGMSIQSAPITGADFGLHGLSKPENTAEEQAIRSYLGEERYSAYVQSKQPDYRKMLSIADANGVERDDSKTAYDVLSNARAELTNLYQDASLNADQRTQRIDAVLSDANVRLSSLVGNTVAEQFVSEVLKGPRLYRN